MRSTPAAILATVLATATPAAAQLCDCGPVASAADGPAYLVVPRTTYVPHTRTTTRTVLVPRTVYLRRKVVVPQTVYTARTRLVVTPAIGLGDPGGWHYGATYVPPGAAYGCTLGAFGCDSSFVAPLGQFGGE